MHKRFRNIAVFTSILFALASSGCSTKEHWQVMREALKSRGMTDVDCYRDDGRLAQLLGLDKVNGLTINYTCWPMEPGSPLAEIGKRMAIDMTVPNAKEGTNKEVCYINPGDGEKPKLDLNGNLTSLLLGACHNNPDWVVQKLTEKPHIPLVIPPTVAPQKGDQVYTSNSESFG
jgi:hypothetical protein